MVRTYVHCLKCVANHSPYSQCEYVGSKIIWIDKLNAQIVHLMQRYFLCNLSSKLQNNFRFYGDDMTRLLQFCDHSNIDIDITSPYKKFKAFFTSGKKLKRSFVERTNKIFRTVLRLFLAKVNNSNDWYFIYKHPDGNSVSIDRSFAIRDKQLTNLVKSASMNNSFDWSTNSFLMMRLGYTNTHRCRFQCKDKKFIQYIMGVSYAEAFLPPDLKKKRDRVCSRLLFMNYSPVGNKEIQSNYSSSVIPRENPTLKEVLEFEENCMQIYNQIKEAISKTNIISIVRSYFNFLCLEIQMMDSNQPEDKISEMLRVDLQHFNHEERVNLFFLNLGSKESIHQNLFQVIVEKGYFKRITLSSTKDKKSKEALYKTFTYNDFDFDMGKIKPMTMVSIMQSRLCSTDFQEESMVHSSSDEDQGPAEEGQPAINYKSEQFIQDEDTTTPDMVSIIVHLDVNKKLDHCTLRYYYSLETQPEQMAEALMQMKKQIKDCNMIANKLEVLKEIKATGTIPKKVKLQEEKDYMEERRDPLFEEMAMPPKRKPSEVTNSQGFSELIGGYLREPRLTDRKSMMTDNYFFDIVSKKDFEFPELITGSDTYKTSIFASVKSEVIQSSPSTIYYLPKLSTPDTFFFLFNKKSLVKVSCFVIEKDPIKATDPKSSFNENVNLGSSVAEQPKKPTLASAERKEKRVTKLITICYYATEEIPGDFGFVNSLVNNLLEKNVLENFRRFIRRMGSMRADSTLAKYFLSEEPREFRFLYPKLNDKTNFLFLLKNNLHLLMSRVTGTIEQQPRKNDHYSLSLRKKTSGIDDDTITDLKKRSSSYAVSESLQANQEDLLQLEWPCMHYVEPSSTDTVFFFNYNDANARLFGPVLFFLNIIESSYDLPVYSEFMANDGQYTTLVKPNEAGDTDFDSLQLQEGVLKPRLSIINGIKHIRHSKDAPTTKTIDKIMFHISSRGSLKEAGLVDMLETALKNSVIELAIEQWLHSMYLKQDLKWRSETAELQLVEYFKIFLNLKIAPPSICQKVISHKIQSITYFKQFVPSVMKSIQKEFGHFFKNKDSIQSSYHFEDSLSSRQDFDTLEDLHQYLSNDFTFDQFGRSFTRSASLDNSFNEEDPEKTPYQTQSIAQSQTVVDRKPTTSKDDCGQSISAVKPNISPNSGPKKFNHYSFDVTKGSVSKRDSFYTVIKLKSPPLTDSTPLDQYSKVNANQSEPKTVSCGHGQEKKMQFPVRRFLLCVEVSTSDIRLLSYNLKEEVVAKLYESLAEEITYQEIRESLVLGLTSARIMSKVSKFPELNDFDARLCDRYEKTKVETHKKLTEHQIGLKLTWDYRFGDKEMSKIKSQEDTVTITERVFEMLGCQANSILPADHRLTFSQRHKMKQLMEAINTTIAVMQSKKKTEALQFKFLPEPTYIDGGWFGELASNMSISQDSKFGLQSDSQTSRIITQTSGYLGLPNPSLAGEGSHRSISYQSKGLQPYSSIQSPFLAKPVKPYKQSFHLHDLDWRIDLPQTRITMQEDIESPSMITESMKLKKTTSSIFDRGEIEKMSDEDNEQEGTDGQIQAEDLKLDNYVEQAIMNLNLLKKNLAIHSFDSVVKQLFSMDEGKRMDHFNKIKPHCSFL